MANRDVIVHHDHYDDSAGFLAQRIIYFVIGIIETILAFRLVLKLLGANPGSGFVSFIYALSQPLVAPFSGIFPGAVTQGLAARAVLEPATLVAMIVFVLIAWGLGRLVDAFAVHPEHVDHFHTDREI